MAQNCGDENVANIQDLPQQYESKVTSVKVPRFKQPGGYDCDFVEKPTSAFQTECSICLQILREPQLISCCGHSFCGVCIGRIKNDGKFCPLCNAEDFNLMHNKGLERSLNELDVNCSYFEQGCCWVGKLGQLSKHLEEDDSSAVCNFVEVKCSHDCGDYYERRSIKQHEEFECLKRPFSCDYCRDFSSTFEDVVSNHYPVCGSYPLPCPNKCDLPYAIERKDLASHVADDCSLTVVDCDFHYAGCAVRLPREDMPNHLRENITHLSLMAAKLMEKDKQIATITSEIVQRQDDLHKEVCTLREENERLKQENVELQESSGIYQSSILALTKKQEDLEKALKCDISTLREENTLHSTMQSRSERSVQSMTDRLQHNVKTCRAELSASMEEHKKGLDEKVSLLYSHTGLPPCSFIMTNFSIQKDKRWFSPVFYTHPRGYKMCLSVDGNGCDTGKGTHVSAGVFLMQGEFDDQLQWPFRGDIIIQLLNQRGGWGHHEFILAFDDQTPDRAACRVTVGKRASMGWGVPEFISHDMLQPNYLQNDQLRFCISKVTCTSI